MFNNCNISSFLVPVVLSDGWSAPTCGCGWAAKSHTTGGPEAGEGKCGKHRLWCIKYLMCLSLRYNCHTWMLNITIKSPAFLYISIVSTNLLSKNQNVVETINSPSWRVNGLFGTHEEASWWPRLANQHRVPENVCVQIHGVFRPERQIKVKQCNLYDIEIDTTREIWGRRGAYVGE